jgi:hypothetical protein
MEKAVIKQDTPFRPGNAEHLSTQRCNKVPKCILELPSANAARFPLTDEEVVVAKKDLIDINFIMSKILYKCFFSSFFLIKQYFL